MSISETARLAGCSAPTIRFYETIGLIPPAHRTAGGRRTYGWPDVKRLQFIRRARDFGMTIEQIRELLNAPMDDPVGCTTAREIVRQRIEEVRQMRGELSRLEGSLLQMAQNCDASCGEAANMACTIFNDIAAAVS